MTDWQPIETAPQDRRILLFRPTAIDWAQVVIGQFNEDEYAARPKPYWEHELERLEGKRETRANGPTHWMPLPVPPTES